MRRTNNFLLGLNVVIVLSISSNSRQGGWAFVITIRVLKREKSITHSWCLVICRVDDNIKTKHVNNLNFVVMSIHFVVFALIGFHCPAGRSIYFVTIVENPWLHISNLRRFFLDLSHFIVSIKVTLVKVSILCATVFLVWFLWRFLTVWNQERCSIPSSVTVPITARFSIYMVKLTN